MYLLHRRRDWILFSETQSLHSHLVVCAQAWSCCSWFWKKERLNGLTYSLVVYKNKRSISYYNWSGVITRVIYYVCVFFGQFRQRATAHLLNDSTSPTLLALTSRRIAKLYCKSLIVYVDVVIMIHRKIWQNSPFNDITESSHQTSTISPLHICSPPSPSVCAHSGQ